MRIAVAKFVHQLPPVKNKVPSPIYKIALPHHVFPGADKAYAAADLLHPPDLYVAGPDGRDERRLSRLNPWLEDMTLSQPRPLAVTSADALPKNVRRL